MQVALLRAINVGGHAKLAMSDLREVFTRLGFPPARTFLQTGKVVFRSDRRRGPALERLIEEALIERLQLQTDVYVRSSKEWQRIIAANPFPDEAAADPARLLVLLLKVAPGTRAVDQLRSSVQGREIIRAVDRELYVYYPAGIGRSKLTNAVIEARLGTRATGRNWNTALKLAAALVSVPSAIRVHE